jgi:hypothetical protein
MRNPGAYSAGIFKQSMGVGSEREKNCRIGMPEPVFVNVSGAQASIPPD